MAQQDKINSIEQEETELAQTSKGIPSVAGKRKNKSKKGAVIGVCLALFLLACISVGFYQKFAPKSVETKEKEPIHYNSAKSLILPSLESITPPEPKPELQQKLKRKSLRLSRVLFLQLRLQYLQSLRELNRGHLKDSVLRQKSKRRSRHWQKNAIWPR